MSSKDFLDGRNIDGRVGLVEKVVLSFRRALSLLVLSSADILAGLNFEAMVLLMGEVENFYMGANHQGMRRDRDLYLVFEDILCKSVSACRERANAATSPPASN